MADPSSTHTQGAVQGAVDRRRAAPPAFAAPVGRPLSSPPQPVTPSPPPHLRSFLPSSRVGSRGKGQVSAEIQAEPDSSAAPAETQESSNRAHSSGSREGRGSDQKSDAESHPNHGLGIVGNSFYFPVGPPLPLPMGPPPSNISQPPLLAGFPSQYPGPPTFASPLRRIPSFDVVPLPITGNNFSEIPLVAKISMPQPGTSNVGNADQTLLAGVSENDFDASSFSASTSFVLFSAQTVAVSYICNLLELPVHFRANY